MSQRTDPARLPARAQRDAMLRGEILRAWEENFQVYGVRKVCRQLAREGFQVARRTVERLVNKLDLLGVRCGRFIRRTVSERSTPCPLDHVQWQFKAERPNALCVSELTYVSSWQSFVYVALIVDVFARRIVGWRVSASAPSDFVLDALEQAPHERQPAQQDRLINRGDGGVQPAFNRSSQRPSIRELQWEQQNMGTIDVEFAQRWVRSADLVSG
ncbi:IS3 family transposase [Paraburkholderia sediminicola]|uniref:IS3 family transposase n=1 Tax=Paraburkholderia sediminicola TaxID=458836 RepID=UPI0038BB1A70